MICQHPPAYLVGVGDLGPLATATRAIGEWPTWPWRLLGWVPEASCSAWNSPAIVVWHLRLDAA